MLSTSTLGGIEYLLEGCSVPESPVLVFANELLTDLRVWERTIVLLRYHYPEFRLLRFNYPHVSSLEGTTVTTDTLAKQLDTLITSLGIKRVHAVIGVGMGGVAALAFASLFPDKVGRVVTCGHNICKTDRELGTWSERVQYAQKYGMGGVIKDKIASNWLTVDSRGSEIWNFLKEMVTLFEKEDLMAYSKLYANYDETERLKSLKPSLLLIVGAQDSVLPEVMTAIPEQIEKDSQITLTMISRASHLPMLEQPKAFMEAMTPVLT